jgi:hypothetical protein
MDEYAILNKGGEMEMIDMANRVVMRSRVWEGISILHGITVTGF